jgi:hypothetical protein
MNSPRHRLSRGGVGQAEEILKYEHLQASGPREGRLRPGSINRRQAEPWRGQPDQLRFQQCPRYTRDQQHGLFILLLGWIQIYSLSGLMSGLAYPPTVCPLDLWLSSSHWVHSSLFSLKFICLLIFWDRILLCSPGWLQIQDPPASAFWIFYIFE